MAKIFTLANEVLACIFRHLNGLDLGTVAKTCQRFRSATYIDQIWQHICVRDYGVSSLDQWNVSSFRELYIIVLHKYGCLLGVWKCNINPYGGLVHIKVYPGKIEAVDCRAPFDPDIKSPLRPKVMFDIKVHDGKAAVMCHSDWDNGSHSGNLMIEETGEGKVPQFHLKCDSWSNHEIPSDREEGMGFLRKWLKEEYNNENLLFIQPHMVQLVLMKYVTMHSLHKKPLTFEALDFQQCNRDNPFLTPGVFKGTYSSHGVEMVMITIEDQRIVATKLTGDPNVPAGQVTFDVDLSRPVTDDAQPSAAAGSGKAQEFQIPPAYEARYTDYPHTYLARYHGKGRIASHGFVSPQWTRGHFVLFNDDMFGFLWIELMAFSVYSRTTEPFLR
nr:F-box only protein 31-like [Pocillopora verrucosa]